jgi:ATP synthase protein I
MNDNRDPVEQYRGLRVAGMLSTAGLTLALSVAVGVGLGYYLDKWLKTHGILVIVFSLVGVVAGFKQFFQIVMQANADQEQEEARDRERQGRGRRKDR